MKQKDVFKKIGGILQELNEQYEYLETVSDSLNDLELELFVANAHFLTDHIEILCKLNLQNRPKRPAIDKSDTTTYQQKFFEPVVQQMKPGLAAKGIKPNITPVKPVAVEVTNKQPEPETPVEKPAEKEKKKAETPEPRFDFPAKKLEEHSEPKFDFAADTPKDSYSFIREEPETIRHELILDEAETWEDENEKEQEEAKGQEAVAEIKADDEKAEEGVPATTVDEQAAAEGQPVIEEQKEEPAATGEVNALPEAVEHTEEVKAGEPAAEAATGEKPADKTEETKDEIEVITRNQQISAQLGDKTLSKTDQLGIKPISDIKLAITLNDKLLYVKDLFNGYNLAYSEAIEILNRFNTFEEAQRFLRANYVTKNNWESKQATADKFYALLRRRYA